MIFENTAVIGRDLLGTDLFKSGPNSIALKLFRRFSLDFAFDYGCTHACFPKPKLYRTNRDITKLTRGVSRGKNLEKSVKKRQESFIDCRWEQEVVCFNDEITRISEMREVNEFWYSFSGEYGGRIETTDKNAAKAALRDGLEVTKVTRRVFQSGPSNVYLTVTTDIKKTKDL